MVLKQNVYMNILRGKNKNKIHGRRGWKFIKFKKSQQISQQFFVINN